MGMNISDILPDLMKKEITWQEYRKPRIGEFGISCGEVRSETRGTNLFIKTTASSKEIAIRVSHPIDLNIPGEKEKIYEVVTKLATLRILQKALEWIYTSIKKHKEDLVIVLLDLQLIGVEEIGSTEINQMRKELRTEIHDPNSENNIIKALDEIYEKLIIWYKELQTLDVHLLNFNNTPQQAYSEDVLVSHQLTYLEEKKEGLYHITGDIR